MTPVYPPEAAAIDATGRVAVRVTLDEIGDPGPITRQVQETFFAAVRGEIDQYKDWNEHV